MNGRILEAHVRHNGLGFRRIHCPHALHGDVLGSRIAIAAGQACNAILRDVEIDALKQQINELKELTLAKLDDAGEDHNGDDDEDEEQRDQT